MYVDKFSDTVNKYNNTYRSTINVKPADIKLNTYIGSEEVLVIKKVKNTVSLIYVFNGLNGE